MTLSKPITIEGQGCSIWADKGPVVVVRSSGVTLKELRIEIPGQGSKALGGREACALLVEGGAGGTFSDVTVMGNVEGLPTEEGEWSLPSAVRLKTLQSGVPHELKVRAYVPVACELRSEVADVDVAPTHLEPGAHEVMLKLDPLADGGRIFGSLEVRTASLCRRVRLSGGARATGPFDYATGDVVYSPQNWDDLTHVKPKPPEIESHPVAPPPSRPARETTAAGQARTPPVDTPAPEPPRRRLVDATPGEAFGSSKTGPAQPEAAPPAAEAPKETVSPPVREPTGPKPRAVRPAPEAPAPKAAKPQAVAEPPAEQAPKEAPSPPVREPTGPKPRSVRPAQEAPAPKAARPPAVEGPPAEQAPSKAPSPPVRESTGPRPRSARGPEQTTAPEAPEPPAPGKPSAAGAATKAVSPPVRQSPGPKPRPPTKPGGAAKPSAPETPADTGKGSAPGKPSPRALPQVGPKPRPTEPAPAADEPEEPQKPAPPARRPGSGKPGEAFSQRK